MAKKRSKNSAGYGDKQTRILELLEQGKSGVEIAAEIGCTAPYVSRVKKAHFGDLPAHAIKRGTGEAIDQFADGQPERLYELIEPLSLMNGARLVALAEKVKRERLEMLHMEQREKDRTGSVSLAAFYDCICKGPELLAAHFQISESVELSEKGEQWVKAWIDYIYSCWPEETERLRRAGFNF